MPDPTDPGDPDIFENERDEAGEINIEAPEADAAEQHFALQQRHDEPLIGREFGEADPADAMEQHQVVELDEDDYRQ